MKKNLSTLLLLLSFLTLTAQEFETIEFGSKADFKKYEPQILKMSSHVLSVPLSNNAQRLTALQNIIKWMSGTPDYKFGLDESIAKLMKNNDEVLGLYMASLTNFVLKNPSKSSDPAEVKLNSFKILLDYCKDANNNVKSTKELRKALEANDRGELNSYLKL